VRRHKYSERAIVTVTVAVKILWLAVDIASVLEIVVTGEPVAGSGVAPISSAGTH